MFSRRSLLTLLSFPLVTRLAAALEVDVFKPFKPFSQAEFDSAVAAGKPVLIAIWADWCPTCKAQAPILGALQQDDPLKKMVTFAVDFDEQADVVRAFGANAQSTLIVFNGKSEVDRLVGETGSAAIKAAMMKAFPA